MSLPGLSFIRKGRATSIIVRTAPALVWLTRMPPPPSVSVFVAKDVMHEFKKTAGYVSARPLLAGGGIPSTSGIDGQGVVARGTAGTTRAVSPVGARPGQRGTLDRRPHQPQHDGSGSGAGSANVAPRRRLGIPNHKRVCRDNEPKESG